MSNQDLINLTLKDLLQNPTGRSSAYMATRSFIINDLQNRYIKLMNKHKKMDFKVFKDGSDYLFYFKVPSETMDKLLYDVIISFSPESDDIKIDRTINRYKLKLFSNSPNFTFTYTYVLNQSNMIVPQLISKCSTQALKDEPKVKNPVGSYGFEKSCYFACLYLKDMGLTNKTLLDQNLFIFDKVKVLSKIKHQDDKIKEYTLIKNQKKTKVKAAKRKPNVAVPKKISLTNRSKTTNKKKKK